MAAKNNIPVLGLCDTLGTFEGTNGSLDDRSGTDLASMLYGPVMGS